MRDIAPSSKEYEQCTCAYFTGGVCNSCSLLAIPSGKRLQAKQEHLREVLAELPLTYSTVTPSRPWGSRNKSKMIIAGTTHEPVIGIVRSDRTTVDLRQCPLMPERVSAFCSDLPRLIRTASLVPYDIAKRTGELKAVIVVITHDHSQGIVRFVLRSTESIPRIRKLLPILAEAHHWAHVVSCNVQPLPAAVLEGPEEILLTEDRYIQERYGPVTLLFAPSSFIQVTHEVSEKLYGAAAAYVQHKGFAHALDLFCGAGGFSYAIAPFVKQVTGVEISASAIESAKAAAALNNVPTPTFIAADTEDFLRNHTQGVDLVVTNPPRRGLSEPIIDALLALAPRSFIYSSCNPETFRRDVQKLLTSGQYRLLSVEAFDMFPLTHHCEVLGILERV